MDPYSILVLRIRKYFLLVPLVARNSTRSYPAVWSVLTELFEFHLVCRHETYPVTIFHVTFSFPGCVCAVLQIGYTSVTGFSSRTTMVTTTSHPNHTSTDSAGLTDETQEVRYSTCCRLLEFVVGLP